MKEEAPVNPSEIVTNEDVKSDDFVVDLSHYTFPNSYVGTYLGPSNAEDPYLVKFMQGKGDPELIPFVTRAIRPVNEEVAFTVYVSVSVTTIFLLFGMRNTRFWKEQSPLSKNS